MIAVRSLLGRGQCFRLSEQNSKGRQTSAFSDGGAGGNHLFLTSRNDISPPLAAVTVVFL